MITPWKTQKQGEKVLCYSRESRWVLEVLTSMIIFSACPLCNPGKNPSASATDSCRAVESPWVRLMLQVFEKSYKSHIFDKLILRLHTWQGRKQSASCSSDCLASLKTVLNAELKHENVDHLCRSQSLKNAVGFYSHSID